MFTFRNVRILFAAALLAAIFCLAGCSTAAQAVPQPAETSRSAEATPETAIPAPTSTPAPTATPEPTPASIVPTSVTLDQEGGILNRGMTWTLRATVLPEDAADKTVRWTSSDESVATIDDAGVITALTPGQTTITAASTAGGVSTTYNLVVQEVVKCSYCGGTGHTANTCAVKKTAEQQAATVAAQQQAAAQAAEQATAAQAAEQPASEAAQPADAVLVHGAGHILLHEFDRTIAGGDVHTCGCIAFRIALFHCYSPNFFSSLGRSFRWRS